jgi:phage/plasmid-like protein (TIGR03299 family)
MAHNIGKTADGRATMFSYREAPWHGLGQVVDCKVDDSKVLDLAGLNWTVDEEPIHQATKTPVGAGDFLTEYKEVPGYKLLRRSDTQNVLGVVPKSFTGIQNQEIVTWFRDLVGVNRDLVWETAGALGDGETVWGLVHIPDLTIDLGKDITKVYMLMSNGHTGNRMLRVYPTGVRVVCQNTLRLSESIAGHISGRAKSRSTLSQGFAIRHTGGIRAAMADIQEAYKSTLNAVVVTRQAHEILASKTLTDALFRELMAKSFKAEDDGKVGIEDKVDSESKRAKTIRENREARLQEILASPTCQVEGTKDTLYSGLQAITEYVDHDRPTRETGKGNEQHNRFTASQFGSGEVVKERAFTTALALAGH